MQSYPIKKSFFQHTKNSISHCTKANEQLQISSAKTYCELAVHLLIFEKISVLRLHYGNPFAPIQSLFAAVLQTKPVSTRAAGNFCEVSSDRALNRGSQGGIVSLKHGRLAHVRSQFSLFRRSPTHKNLPLATFCTSEQHYPCCCRNNSCRFAATPGGIAAFRKYVRFRKPHIFTKTILKKSIIRAIIL